MTKSLLEEADDYDKEKDRAEDVFYREVQKRYLLTKGTGDGYSVKTPDLCSDEILPAGWCDFAEAKGIPYDQIYVSWRKFKQVSRFPFQFRRWQRWIDR